MMVHYPIQLDEIDQWLVDNFGIMPGTCSSTENIRYITARMIAVVLWPKCKDSLHIQETCKENGDSFTDDIDGERDQVEGPSRDQVDKLEEAAEKAGLEYEPIVAGEAIDSNGQCYETDDVNWPSRCGFNNGFKAGAKWQREQDESRKRANVTLANTVHPKDKQVEIAFEDIWLDAEVSVEAFGAVDANLTNSMKSLCHDFFEAGADWQREQDHYACRQCEKAYDNVFYKGEQHAIKMLKEEAIEASCFGGKEGEEHIVTFVVPCFKIKNYYKLGDTAKIYIFIDNKK